MGNIIGFPWVVAFLEDSNEVLVDLTLIRADLPYNFPPLKGNVPLFFNLEKKIIALGDVAVLARKWHSLSHRN